MGPGELVALLPLMAVAATSIAVMLAIAVHRDHRVALALTLAGLGLGFASLPVTLPHLPRQVTPLLVVDEYALFYMGLLFAGGFAAAVLSFGYLERRGGNREEFYVLLLLATMGSAVLVASTHFASFFLGLEILSVSLYALIAYPLVQANNVEAAVKYLILAGASSAFLLFGMALVYAELGTMALGEIAASPALARAPNVVLAGLGMLTVGVGFKLALVPFHMWTPDVYQGAPAPVTGFIATVSKGGVFALLLRYFSQVPITQLGALFSTFAAIAIASMLVGNLLAVLQNNVKRILAYSSIAHLGYLLVAFLASGGFAPRAVAFYLVAYFATTLSAFGVVTALSAPDREAEGIDEYRGLIYRRPWLAVILTAALLSLAGLPPSAGLVGKIFIAAAGIESALWLLLSALVVGSVIGVFYYLRIGLAMYRRPLPGMEAARAAPSLSRVGGVVLAVLTFLTVGLGLYPGPVLRIIEAMATHPA